jgi:hypothetical protein
VATVGEGTEGGSGLTRRQSSPSFVNSFETIF